MEIIPVITDSRYYGLSLFTELRTLHVAPNKHFYCFTPVTTDTLVTTNTLRYCTCTAVQ